MGLLLGLPLGLLLGLLLDLGFATGFANGFGVCGWIAIALPHHLQGGFSTPSVNNMSGGVLKQSSTRFTFNGRVTQDQSTKGSREEDTYKR